MATQTGVLVVLYADPTLAIWDTIIRAKTNHPTVPITCIIDPTTTGAGNASDPNYVALIQKLQAANIKCIGYIDTGFGRRIVSQVQTEIDDWWNWYKVDGVMFDQMSNVLGFEAYYFTLSAYAKTKGMTITVGNPGTATLPSFIGSVDNMIIREDVGVPSVAELQALTAGFDKSNFSFVSEAVFSLNAALIRATTNYVSYIYLNNQASPSPYNVLPGYFTTLVATLDLSITPPPAKKVTTITIIETYDDLTTKTTNIIA